MIAFFFFFHMVHWSFILGQEWLLSNHVCNACQNCLHPSFALLLCCESSRKCHHAAQTTRTWTKTILTFYKIYCCSARISMNNVPNESRIIMLSCIEISFVISFFDFEIHVFGVKPRFPFLFFFYSHLYMYWWIILRFVWSSLKPQE